jgi:ABC-type transport system substrate-binding protein
MPAMVPMEIVEGIQAYLAEVGINAEIEPLTMGQFSEYRTVGWTNGLMIQRCLRYVNWHRTVDFYFSTLYSATERPEGFEEALSAALSSPLPEPALVQNVTRVIFDGVMFMPVEMGWSGTTAYTEKLKNPGFGDFSTHYAWTPATAYLEE